MHRRRSRSFCQCKAASIASQQAEIAASGGSRSTSQKSAPKLEHRHLGCAKLSVIACWLQRHTHALPITETVSVAIAAPCSSCAVVQACKQSPSYASLLALNQEQHTETDIHSMRPVQCKFDLRQQSLSMVASPNSQLVSVCSTCAASQVTKHGPYKHSICCEHTLRLSLQMPSCWCCSCAKSCDCLTRQIGTMCTSPVLVLPLRALRPSVEFRLTSPHRSYACMPCSAPLCHLKTTGITHSLNLSPALLQPLVKTKHLNSQDTGSQASPVHAGK